MHIRPEWSSPRISSSYKRAAYLAVFAFIVSGCATTSEPLKPKESDEISRAEQQRAQQEIKLALPAMPTLKRKLAIGRFSNETTYGRSLWRDQDGDPLGKQASDMLMSRLIDTGRYMVFERPDLSKIENEQVILGDRELVGVDALIMGSVTEFGRSTTGKTGFLSDTKLQTARAVVEVRLVDVRTGYAFFTASGKGEASLESGDVAGFGSKAAYDATLNDKAIGAAISDLTEELLNELGQRPWQTSILSYEDSLLYLSGGERQGLTKGDKFAVMRPGKRIKSKQTGFDIDLPATKIATIQIESFFGDSEVNEGSVAVVVSGTMPDDIADLFVAEQTE